MRSIEIKPIKKVAENWKIWLKDIKEKIKEIN